MKSRLQSGKSRIFVLLTVFVAVLILVGVLMHVKLRALLRGNIERQVAAQVKGVAQVAESELETELKKLETVSGLFESGKVSMSTLFTMLQEENPSSVFGILELDGETVQGEAMDVSGFSGVREAFRGNRGVSYQEGTGLLFSVPIYHNGNVKYVLYELMEEDVLPEMVTLSCFHGEGKILLATREEEIIIPYESWGEEDLRFLRSNAATDAFASISEKMIIATEGAAYCKEYGKQYLFVANVGDYDFVVVGSVDEETAAEGIFVIIKLVFWVFGLLLLLLAIGMAFVFGAEEKAKESEELRRAKEIADSANRAKSDFLANMSHEIRTPINTVMGMNEMIIRECKEESIKEYACNIQNASKTLLTLINDILDLSKIEAGKMEIIKERYFLSSVLNGVVNMVQVRANQKKLNFIVEVDETIPDELYGDEIRLRQVMVNLLNNAVKYTRTGSVWLKIEKEDVREKDIVLRITVKDTGIGIREADIGKLFHGFERLDQEKNRNVEGTGLGLAITSKIVDLMQGELKVESVYKEGSTFTVLLPQKIIRPDGIGDFEEKYHAYIQSLQSYRESFRAPEAEILVVDDNDMNLFVFENLLKKTQVKITKCTGGEACLDLVCEKKFDIIFLDHMMPGMDGIETMKQMREMEEYASKGAPVIALTANAIVGVRDMYIAEGFDDYLSKPIVGDELEEMLQRYIPKGKLLSEPVESAEETISETLPSGEEKQEETQWIDRELGLRYSGESEEMYREFMKMYCEMMPEKKERLEQCFREEDWENYTIAVHALKSTSLSIGGKILSEKALALEKAGKAQEFSFIKENHQDAMECYEKTVQEGRERIL
ncbi:MAG: response regulator [Lachnospiraceae bacterium]|nr:response regulator [Lachnospiraceae bacterium]